MSPATVMATATLPVSEVFGPTVQGEGPAAGRVAAFVRLGGCNLSCSWCDTPYTWDGARFDLRSELAPTAPADVAARVGAAHAPLVVLTGGEPLLYQHSPAWGWLLDGLRAGGRVVHVETNGTILPTEVTLAGVATFVISPKLANAGAHRGRQDPALHPCWPDLARQADAHLKIVCADVADVAAAAEMADRVGWPPGRVWVMPLGATREQLAGTWPAVAEAAAGHGINATHRLHVLAWGDQRGR